MILKNKLKMMLGILLFGVNLFYSLDSFPQYIPEVERLFQKALQNYRNEKFELAEVELENLIKVFPQNHRTTASLLLLGKTQYKLKKYQRSISTILRLLEGYPKSTYVDDGHYQLASSYFRQARFRDAVRELLWVLDFSSDKRIQKKSTELAVRIMILKLSPENFPRLVGEAKTERGAWTLTKALADKELEVGEREQTVAILKTFLNFYPKGIYASKAKDLLETIKIEKEGRVKIGVILPLTGYYRDESRDLLNGIKFALERYNRAEQGKVEIIVRDSEGTAVKAVRAAQELVKDEEVIALIGELGSDNTAAVAAVAQSHGVPLISPTATDNDIAAIGDFVFQVNNDLDTRGRKIAFYAVRNLGLKTFAILAPADAYGREMTDAFATTVDRLGGKILAETWYYGGTKDFSRQFQYIRELGLEQMFKDSLRAAENSLSRTQLDSLWNVFQTERRQKWREQEEENEEIDTTAVPVTAIDGIFFPVYTDDIEYIAPRFVMYNIKAQILGGGYWNDREILLANRSYVNGAIFSSDFFVDGSDPDYIRFRDDFRKAMGKTPEKMEVFGYDAINLVLESLKRGASTRRKLQKQLVSINNFEGMRGRISFTEKPRVNSGINILKFEKGRIFRVQ